ncbi:hypothetical protein QBC35DRAFT_454903 [Podospora australis]|uniref:DUF7707 domain-containing protein n=1 Tax=Podospora australis TaxID=1536484 RepID=A0AAN7AF17_9PEZI|nr:hypothetical protein QBC35DRAFT_454903 [Podospora australis]
MVSKSSSLLVLAFTAATSALAPPEYGRWDCYMPATRSGPGRSVSSFGNNVCPKNVAVCDALCNGNVSANLCASNNEGEDHPYSRITYCYKCICADGTRPLLNAYQDTVLDLNCQRMRQNCQYSYSQVGQVAPEGACLPCASSQAATTSTTYHPKAPAVPEYVVAYVHNTPVVVRGSEAPLLTVSTVKWKTTMKLPSPTPVFDQESTSLLSTTQSYRMIGNIVAVQPGSTTMSLVVGEQTEIQATSIEATPTVASETVASETFASETAMATSGAGFTKPWGLLSLSLVGLLAL